MPGRVAREGDRASAAAATRKTGARRSARTSSPVNEIPDEGEDSSLRRAVCTVFSDAQKSTAGHRKCVISLRKIQEACCYEPVNQKKGKQSEDFDEEEFNVEVVRCILRILAVKKSEPVGDRIVRFIGTYLHVASQKDNELVSQDDIETTALPETPTSRLTTQILGTLLQLMMSKDKTIRFRATQVTSHIINSLDSLDDNLFHLLRTNLLKRIHDKEAPVRLQAVYGLGRLAAEVDEEDDEEDSDSDQETGSRVLARLLDVLQNDPSAEVRRNLLLNLPLTKEVLPYLLERARDMDGSTRRALYARLLPALGDFRHLSLTHREKLLRWGLRDRDENVRKATARLFRERWIEDCAGMPAAQAEEREENGQLAQTSQAADPSLDALLELLERIDVVNSGAEGGIALIAMKEFWEGRPDYVDYVSFPDSFWEDLTPELAFVVRTFNDFCRTSGKEDGYAGPRMLDVIAEEKLPEVTKFGFLLEKEINRLTETIRTTASGEEDEAEEEAVQREFVIEQMLHMALTFDYSDEVGRRKMFSLMREALADPNLPEESTKLVVEVLRLVCGEDVQGEREFCGIVLEAVAEVHDTIMDEGEGSGVDSSVEDSFHSATSILEDGSTSHTHKNGKKSRKTGEQDVEASEQNDEEKAIREIMVNMKCLHIAQCMLQNVKCELEESVHLVTMLNNLVVPAVRSQEAPVRERGLVCLGLCCLLGKNLAQENLTLFLHCFSKGHARLQTIALQIITDILITHPSLLAEPSTSTDTTETSTKEEPNPLLKPILKTFSKSLKSSDHSVQATGAAGLAKMMLGQIIRDTDLLKQLVVAYFDPDTSSNAQLRQSLSYFLPMYCHSRAENAARMVTVACPIIAKLTTLREAFLEDVADVEGEENGMVKLSAVGNMLLDWTDPRKIYGFAEASGAVNVAEGAGQIHYLLAEAILDRLVTSQVSKEEKKVLFSVLGRIHLPAGGCDGELLKSILELVAEAFETKVASDVTSRNALSKLQTQMLKLMHDVATVERGGGGGEETLLETTELPGVASTAAGAEDTEGNIAQSPGDDAEASDEEDDVTQLMREMQESTIGVTTMGAPDAEGTRVNLGVDMSEMEDSEMMDVTD